MESTAATPPPAAPPPQRSRFAALAWVLVVGGLLLIIYAPLLLWLGQAGSQISQLSTGGVLVLLAMAVSVRATLRRAAFQPAIRQSGLVLLVAALAFLASAGYLPRLTFPLVLLSFCLALAAVIAFLFGRVGVSQFMPALGAMFVFGLMAGLFPSLDWPLRATAARYAAGFLSWLGVPVELALDLRRAPELLLMVSGHVFIVATECNGFGLLASSLLLATILVFHLRLPWVNKLGLLLLAVPIAIGCNFLRIVSIAVIAPRVPIPYMVVHEVLGLLFYYLGLGLIWFAADRRRAEDSSPPTAAPSDQPPAAATIS